LLRRRVPDATSSSVAASPGVIRDLKTELPTVSRTEPAHYTG
jgi:hypothetical protein